MVETFERVHKKQNGFSLSTNILRVEYVVEHLIKEPEKYKRDEINYPEESAEKFILKEKDVFINNKFTKIPVYNIEDMKNCLINGPALLLSKTSSILIK